MTKLNEQLLITQKCSETQIQKLQSLYSHLDEIIYLSHNKTLSESDYKSFAKEVEEIEFELQDNWNFERNSNYHRHHYKLKGCLCNTTDNKEAYPYRRINYGECPYHGERI